MIRCKVCLALQAYLYRPISLATLRIAVLLPFVPDPQGWSALELRLPTHGQTAFQHPPVIMPGEASAADEKARAYICLAKACCET